MTIRFGSDAKPSDVVRDLSFHVDRGETLSIVGESGSGKSVSSLALMRIVENGGGRIINVGSVGQPRDGDTRLSYVLFDGRCITFVRLEYSHEIAADRIRAVTELPDYLADRLAVGR